MSFPGLCVRCGGPQVWTLVSGDVWVACEHDCLSEQLDAFGRNPPLMAISSEGEDHLEPLEGERVGPLEGSAADEEPRAI